jgi:hypothetical protein
MDTACIFAVKGIRIKKATLIAGDCKLSVVSPINSSDWTSDTIVPLPFFGDELFHCNLAPKSRIEFITEEDGFPTLMMQPCRDRQVEYDNGIFKQNVTTTNDKGEARDFILVYTPKLCGFQAR